MQFVKSKLTMVLPVVAAAVLGLVLSNLTMSQTGNANAQVSPFSDVERVLVSQNSVPQEPVMEAAGGAGFQPSYMADECDCDCLAESDIRKIVQDEFDKQMRAERVAPRSSIPNAVAYSTSATVSSPAVVSSPTVVRYSNGATTVVQSSGTCRYVNGQKVCDVPQSATVHVQAAPVRRGLFGRWRSR